MIRIRRTLTGLVRSPLIYIAVVFPLALGFFHTKMAPLPVAVPKVEQSDYYAPYGLYRVVPSMFSDRVAELGRRDQKYHIWITSAGITQVDFPASQGLTDAAFIESDRALLLAYAHGGHGYLELRDLQSGQGRLLMRMVLSGPAYRLISANASQDDVLYTHDKVAELCRVDIKNHTCAHVASLPGSTRLISRAGDVLAYEDSNTHRTVFYNLKNGVTYAAPIFGTDISCDEATSRCFVLAGAQPEHPAVVAVDATTGLPQHTIDVLAYAVSVAVGNDGALYVGGGPTGGWVYRRIAANGFPQLGPNT